MMDFLVYSCHEIVVRLQESSSFRTLTHTLTRMGNNKNNGIYQRNGMKKRCFSLFSVVKKNEKQHFLNLITRRSSVQIWLPQPKSAVNSLFYGTIFLHFYRKHDFDPNLTPKHRKKNGAGYFVLFHSFFYKLIITINSFCCKTISFTGVGVGGYMVANF